MLKGIVGTDQQKMATSAHEVWLVEARSEEEQAQLERSAEEVIVKLQDMQEQAKHTVQARQRLPGQKIKRGAREQIQGNTWGRMESVSAEEQAQKEYLDALMEEVGACTVDCITASKWDEDCARAVVPINGVNTTDEPMVFRGGQRIADATKLHSSMRNVNNLVEQHTTVGTDTSSCDEGTTTDGMITDTAHASGDWRAGQSYKEIINMTKAGPRNEESKAWRAKMEAKIKVGEEAGQEGAVSEAVKVKAMPTGHFALYPAELCFN